MAAAHWGYAQIGAVCDAGLMQGTSPTTFSPDSPVSRQEAMALVLAALRYSAQDTTAGGRATPSPSQVDGWLAGFQDRNLIDPQYGGSVAIAYSLGLSTCRPAAGCCRSSA